MAKYAYPAIFTPEPDGSYSIVFPDLKNCFTYGDNLEDGIEMAENPHPESNAEIIKSV